MAGLTPLGLNGKEAPESSMIFSVFFFQNNYLRYIIYCFGHKFMKTAS